MMHQHGHLEVDGLDFFFVCQVFSPNLFDAAAEAHRSCPCRQMIFLEANVAFQVLAKEGSLVRPQVRVLFRVLNT